jgi:Tfp pilus assembly protein PilO
MRLSPRNQFILTIVGLTLLLIALVALLIVPQYTKRNALQQQINQVTQEVSVAKTLLAQRQQIKDRAAQTDAEWLRLANMVPESPDLPSLIIELQDVAFTSGVKMLGITPAVPVVGTTGQYQTLPISLNVSGSWADNVDYLQRILKIERGLRIVGFSSAGVDDGSAVTTNITIEAYMIPATSSTTTATGQ